MHYIDVVSLTEVLNKFSEAIGLSIALLDASGNYIIRTENDPPCKLMFDTTEGNIVKNMLRMPVKIVMFLEAAPLFLNAVMTLSVSWCLLSVAAVGWDIFGVVKYF